MATDFHTKIHQQRWLHVHTADLLASRILSSQVRVRVARLSWVRVWSQVVQISDSSRTESLRLESPSQDWRRVALREAVVPLPAVRWRRRAGTGGRRRPSRCRRSPGSGIRAARSRWWRRRAGRWGGWRCPTRPRRWCVARRPPAARRSRPRAAPSGPTPCWWPSRHQRHLAGAPPTTHTHVTALHIIAAKYLAAGYSRGPSGFNNRFMDGWRLINA